MNVYKLSISSLISLGEGDEFFCTEHYPYFKGVILSIKKLGLQGINFTLTRHSVGKHLEITGFEGTLFTVSSYFYIFFPRSFPRSLPFPGVYV